MKKRGKSKSRELLNIIVYLIAIIALSYLVNAFVFQRALVDGSSMNPTLEDGDNLITDKISYRFCDPKRYDIIVFPYQQDKQIFYIKRIIGLPGETIQISDGVIYINGEVLSEDYGRDTMYTGGIAEVPLTLGNDEYFVLGDNRNNSKDSRVASVGTIKRDEIIGRALFRIWPLTKMGFLRHQ